jgi:mono/diheme cytochrome c family protein
MCASMWRAFSACLRVGIAIWFLMAAGTWLMSAPVHGQSSDRLPPGTGLDVVRARCLSCHGADLIEQQRLSRAGWDREIDKMIAWGAVVQEPERGALAGYLADHFGPSGRSESISTEHPGRALVETRCLGCHDGQLIEQQRLSVDGWRREIDKMRGWGAPVTNVEKEMLAEYLASRRSP